MARGRHRPGTGPQKPIFKDLVIAIASSLDGQWTEVNVARWVSQRDGHFVAQMGANVTHLVCSEEAYQARGPRGTLPFLFAFPLPTPRPRPLPLALPLHRPKTPDIPTQWTLTLTLSGTVKEALSRPKSCYLVTKDWLEDSINAKRRVKEDAFHPNKKEQEARRMKMEKERKRILEEKEKKGEELAVRAVNPCEFLVLVFVVIIGKREADVRTVLWHRYRDVTWFRYEVVISRVEVEVERKFELSVSFSPFLFSFRGWGERGGHTCSPFPTTNFIPHTFPTLPIRPPQLNIPHIPTNTPPPPALRIQRQTPPLLVCRQILQTQGRQPAQLLPPQRHPRSLLARV